MSDTDTERWKPDSSDSDDEDELAQIDEDQWKSEWEFFSKRNHISTMHTVQQMRQFLEETGINLSAATCETLFAICDKTPNGHLRNTVLKNQLRKAIKQHEGQGLTLDQAVGGLIMEFHASKKGRNYRKQKSIMSMHALLAGSITKMENYNKELTALHNSCPQMTPEEKLKQKIDDREQRRLKRERLHAKEKRRSEEPRHLLKPATNTNNSSSLPITPLKNQVPESKTSAKVSTIDENAALKVSTRPRRSSNSRPRRSSNSSRPRRSSNASPRNRQKKESARSSVNLDLPNSKKSLRSGSTMISRNKRHSSPRQFGKSNFQSASASVNINLADIPGGLEVVELLKKQESMLYRLQMQVLSFENQLRISLFNDVNHTVLMNVMRSIQNLKDSAFAQLKREVVQLKQELMAEFESLAISTAFEVSMNIKKDLHVLAQTVDRTTRLWSNDWNVTKLTYANQDKLSSLLFDAEKIIAKYSELSASGKIHFRKSNTPTPRHERKHSASGGLPPRSALQLSSAASGDSAFGLSSGTSKPTHSRRMRSIRFKDDFKEDVKDDTTDDATPVSLATPLSATGGYRSHAHRKTGSLFNLPTGADLFPDVTPSSREGTVTAESRAVMSKTTSNKMLQEIDNMKVQLSSMQYYLNSFVYDRLSRIEKAIVRIFQFSANFASVTNQALPQKAAKKMFTVDEVMNQLDSQRLNLAGQIRRQKAKSQAAQMQLNKEKAIIEQEREKLNEEMKKMSQFKAKYEAETAKTKQFEFEIELLRAQLASQTQANNSVPKTIDVRESDSKQSTPAPDFYDSMTDRSDVKHTDIPTDLDFEEKFSNSLATMCSDFIVRSKMQSQRKANDKFSELTEPDTKLKHRGHIRYKKNELPEFLKSIDLDDGMIELEERLGFGWQELYYLYRENTELQAKWNRAATENLLLRQQLKRTTPCIIIENLHIFKTSVAVELQELVEKLQSSRHRLEENERKMTSAEKQLKYVDRFRIQALYDKKKIGEELKASMALDKFQFDVERKRIKSLMAKERANIANEHKLLEKKREEISKLKLEWEEKENTFAEKERKFGEAVHLAKTNMNEVIYQRGFEKHLNQYKDKLREELVSNIDNKMLYLECSRIRNEYDAKLAKYKNIYEKRISTNASRNNATVHRLELTKLRLKQEVSDKARVQKQVYAAQRENAKLQAKFDVLENEYKTKKQKFMKYKMNRRQEMIKKAKHHDDDDDSDDNASDSNKNKKSNKVDPVEEWLAQREDGEKIRPHWYLRPRERVESLELEVKNLKNLVQTYKTQMEDAHQLVGELEGRISTFKANNARRKSLLESMNIRQESVFSTLEPEITNTKNRVNSLQTLIHKLTKIEHKWVVKNDELLKREKELSRERETLIYDQRMWYAHKNHILRNFHFFIKQIWWERFLMHEYHLDRFENDPKETAWWLTQKILFETWWEAGVYHHALTRWFCKLSTNKDELALFTVKNVDKEERYLFKVPVREYIKPHLIDVQERYYRTKWTKRFQRFGRRWLDPNQKNGRQKKYSKFLEWVKRTTSHIHASDPNFNELELKQVLRRMNREFEKKLKSFSRPIWDSVKNSDPVGMLKKPPPKTSSQSVKDTKSITASASASAKKTGKTVSVPPDAKKRTARSSLVVGKQPPGKVTSRIPKKEKNDDSKDDDSKDGSAETPRKRVRMAPSSHNTQTTYDATSKNSGGGGGGGRSRKNKDVGWSHSMQDFKGGGKQGKSKGKQKRSDVPVKKSKKKTLSPIISDPKSKKGKGSSKSGKTSGK